jgi:hypothetical protein
MRTVRPERAVRGPEMHGYSDRRGFLANRQVTWTLDRAVFNHVSDALFDQADENHRLKRIHKPRNIARENEVSVKFGGVGQRAKRKVVLVLV